MPGGQAGRALFVRRGGRMPARVERIDVLSGARHPWKELRPADLAGLITEADLDEGLRRKFRVSLKLGLLDPPAVVPYAKAKDGPAPWDSEEHLAISKTMAVESIVLLKNAGERSRFARAR
jgi:beta-glucosidase